MVDEETADDVNDGELSAAGAGKIKFNEFTIKSANGKGLITERQRNQMKQEQQETIEQQPQLEDLAVEKSEDVKGGPIYMKVEGVKGDVTAEGFDR